MPRKNPRQKKIEFNQLNKTHALVEKKGKTLKPLAAAVILKGRKRRYPHRERQRAGKRTPQHKKRESKIDRCHLQEGRTRREQWTHKSPTASDDGTEGKKLGGGG